MNTAAVGRALMLKQRMGKHARSIQLILSVVAPPARQVVQTQLDRAEPTSKQHGPHSRRPQGSEGFY
jgi:hypothetical protein